MTVDVLEQTQIREALEPGRHRPLAPPSVEDRGVAQDDVQVPDRWRLDVVVLVVGAGATDPPVP
ncbi:hypothetical protein M3B33_08895 [Janibacter hoylei]|uniref:hypothetical protein n=1 Tax=Janibacter hoylei TaxID=364298 RepID=UPI0021A5A925|nr:hypothetical protein [Janibacter hoylei]MCT1619207.1 hypothetical protein [Janibacter hoylei]